MSFAGWQQRVHGLVDFLPGVRAGVPRPDGKVYLTLGADKTLRMR